MDVLASEAGFYYGTSNVVLPVPNKGYLPPEFQSKTRLQYYASLFNSVEVNSSFYKIPLGRTVEKWANEVPDNFRFTFKFSKAITHARELDYGPVDMGRFLEAINRVGDKKGCLLIQFPASVKFSFFFKLKKLLADIQATGAVNGWHIAIEFRDKSWYRDEVYQLLEQHSAAVVVHDIPASATPLIDMESNFVYLRFHGENGRYRGTYDDAYLQEYAAYIRDWMEEGKTVFAYFNNTMGEAVHNVRTLKDYVNNIG
jgi:uncharacterized protein YecE (DUF72 family)